LPSPFILGKIFFLPLHLFPFFTKSVYAW
jgi:hypothetical protein